MEKGICKYKLGERRRVRNSAVLYRGRRFLSANSILPASLGRRLQSWYHILFNTAHDPSLAEAKQMHPETNKMLAPSVLLQRPGRGPRRRRRACSLRPPWHRVLASSADSPGCLPQPAGWGCRFPQPPGPWATPRRPVLRSASSWRRLQVPTAKVIKCMLLQWGGGPHGGLGGAAGTKIVRKATNPETGHVHR